MTYDTIRIAADSGRITLTIDRPRCLNALSTRVFVEMLDALDRLARDPTVVALIITGAGPRAFVAGADIRGMQRMSPAEGERFAALGQQVTCRIEALPFPVIACVDGFALGGGCELALSCDFIYATERSSFGQPEVELGLIPCFGGCVRLARAIGPGRARELIYTGRRVPAPEALSMGLVNAVYADRAAMLAAAAATVTRIAGRGRTAVGLCKQAIYGAADRTLAEGLALERAGFRAAVASVDGRAGMTAFVEKRAAVFAAARCDLPPPPATRPADHAPSARA